MPQRRFPPLAPGQMSEAQRTVQEQILSGPRKGTEGPFSALLRSPGLADTAQRLGAHVRFGSSIPARLNELAILITARRWTAQFEWYAHRRLAMAAGLAPAIADSIAAGRRPDGMEEDERVVYEFCQPLAQTGQVADAAFDAAVALFGEQGVVDLIGAVGYYSLVSFVLNVDRTPLPEGESLPLAPLPAVTG